MKHHKFNKTYHVERRMYCFHESLPASRPPPVAFSPPKAPPISAPFVGMFAFTIPQSLPRGLHHIHTHEQVKYTIYATINHHKHLIGVLVKY